MQQLQEWEKFEEEVAKFLNGKRQKGSGNGPIQKGDIKAKDFLVECKYTSKDFYSLSYKTWEKIVEEALNTDRIPLFACRSNNGDYFLGSSLDFGSEDDEFIKINTKSVKIDKDMSFEISGTRIKHYLKCWKVNLSEGDL